MGEPATQNFATQRLAAGHNAPPAGNHPVPNGASAKRWSTGRDVVAGVLLLIAPLFPWNLYFGIGVPNSSAAVFALLAVVTALSLVAIVASHAINSRPGHSGAARLRVTLNAPYTLLVAGFVGFDVVQTVRYGGSANVPGGVGPGAWLGLAGALLGAQPTITGADADEDRFRRWLLPARIAGYVSIALAVLSVSFNLFWRTKGALPNSTGSSGFGKSNAAIIATAVVYGLVALLPVIVAARWIVQSSRASRLATVALGVSTLAAGVVVWVLPAGREIDGFHGIAQNTSTAGVGFEGYVAWAAAAAIFAPLTLRGVVSNHQIDRGVWRAAARKGLLLIAIWCLASALMRVTDVVVAAVLHLSRAPYDSAAMAAFDVVTAALAIWLSINLVNRTLPVAVTSSLCGVLLVLSVSRIVVGVALSPRIAGTSAAAGNPVYGNNLAQQITSTFDVVLSGLALCILAVAVITARFVQRRPHPEARDDNRIRPTPPTAAGWDAATTQLRPPGAGHAAPRQQPAPPPRIHRPMDQSTRRIPVTPNREDATQQLSTRAPRIFQPGQRDVAPPPPRPGQQGPTGPPKIYRAQPNPRGRPDGGPTGGGRPPG